MRRFKVLKSFAFEIVILLIMIVGVMWLFCTYRQDSKMTCIDGICYSAGALRNLKEMGIDIVQKGINNAK